MLDRAMNRTRQAMKTTIMPVSYRLLGDAFDERNNVFFTVIQDGMGSEDLIDAY